MDVEGLVASAERASSLLVATDFDGTIAEIVPRPADARAAPEAISALGILARCPRTYVAVLSGRALPDLAGRTPIPAIWRVGEHGSFLEPPSGSPPLPAWEAAPERVDEALFASLAAAAGRTAATVAGMRVERKAAGVALHYREVPAERRAHALSAAAEWATLVERAGLRLLHGRQMIEAKSGERSKGTALAAILRALPPALLVVYAGDDRTDEDAIEVARAAGGIGVYVASPERPRPQVPADLLVEGPAAWVAILGAIAARRS
jgi:trehalose 6-phosphate phosphatase